MLFERDVVLNDLRNNVVEVTFTKVNGEERVMRCTLRPDLLPKTFNEEKEQEENFHRENKNAIAAWDVQKGGWRSFRIDSVSYLQVVDNY